MNYLAKNVYYIIIALFVPVIILVIVQNAGDQAIRLLSLFGFIALFVGIVTLVVMAIERAK